MTLHKLNYGRMTLPLRQPEATHVFPQLLLHVVPALFVRVAHLVALEMAIVVMVLPLGLLLLARRLRIVFFTKDQ